MDRVVAEDRQTHADNFRAYILPAIGGADATRLTGLQLDDLYLSLEDDRGLSPAVRCHSQIRAMFNGALRKKLVPANPSLAADPPKV